MSQHRITLHSTKLDARLDIQIGYDRPMNHIYCVVERENASDDDGLLYSNLFDPARFGAQHVEDFAQPLADLGITLPESVLANVRQDQASRVVNRLVTYDAQGVVIHDKQI